MNPYNVGVAHNFRDVFCAKIPASKNNFRAKVKCDFSSSFNSSMYPSRSLSPEMSKVSHNIEIDKRQAVEKDEFEEMQRQIKSIGDLERCEPQPMRNKWEHKRERSPESHITNVEILAEHGAKDREKTIRAR